MKISLLPITLSILGAYSAPQTGTNQRGLRDAPIIDQIPVSYLPYLIPTPAVAQNIFNYFTNAYHEVRSRQQQLLDVLNCRGCKEFATPWYKLLSSLEKIPNISWIQTPDSSIRKPIVVADPPLDIILPTQRPTVKPTTPPTPQVQPTAPPSNGDFIWYPSISNPYGAYPGFYGYRTVKSQ